MNHDGGSRLAERAGYLRSPGGLAAGFWWLVRRVSRLEYDWLMACRLDARAPAAGPSGPWRLHRIAGAADLAALGPALTAQLERHTPTSLAGLVAAGERVYVLADGDDVACQLNVAPGPRARVGAPIPGWFDLPPGSAYQSFTYTHQRHRRRGAARRLYQLMHADLARDGIRTVYALVSRTNVPQLGNVAALGYRRAARVWATPGGRLLSVRGLERLGIRHRASAATPGWQLTPVHSPRDLPAQPWPATGALEHDPRWLAVALDGGSAAVWLACRDGQPACALFVHDSRLALDFGEFTIGRIAVRRHVLTGGLVAGPGGAEDCAGLLLALRAAIGPRGVVFLQGLGQGEPLRAALDHPSVRRAWLVLRHGPVYRRCRILLPASFAAYLEGLRGSVRKDLKRALRQFRERHGEAVRMEVVTTPQALEAVLPELEALSLRTYQGRLLGQAVGGLIAAQLRQAMAGGFGRLDLLRVGDELVSYQIGYLHGGTLHATHAGYDPAWAASSPGIVHLALIIEELCRPGSGCSVFDFMYGESPYKARLSNDFHPEAHYYLLPRTLRGRATWLALRAVAAAAGTAGDVLERLRLKDTVRRLMRRGGA